MIRRAIGVAVAAAVLFLSVPATADFDHGVRALQAGDFDGARTQFAALADAGDHLAEFMLGVMAENGFGQDRDVAGAAEWYRKSSDGGVASASFNLALLYQVGAGVDQDMEEAGRLLNHAAEAGHGKAMHNLGRLHEEGAFGAPDLAEAWLWYAAATAHLVLDNRAVAARSLSELEMHITTEVQAEGERRYKAWMAEHGKPVSAPPPDQQ